MASTQLVHIKDTTMSKNPAAMSQAQEGQRD